MVLQSILHVFITLLLLSSPITTERASGTSRLPLSAAPYVNDWSIPQRSLWGNVVDFTRANCARWRLKVSLPALQELTACFSMKSKTTEDHTPWTAFMYTHGEAQGAALGLGGREGRLVVWLLGTKWTTTGMVLPRSQWSSLCLTWTQTKDRPALYVNGDLVDIQAESTPSCTDPSCELAANGTLTLGASRHLVNGKVISRPAPVGKLSLFRLWDRERSHQEVISQCTEGSLVQWEMDDWDSQACDPIPDPSLQCGEPMENNIYIHWNMYFSDKVQRFLSNLNARSLDIFFPFSHSVNAPKQ
ncbi:adhesion G-protein coupled receptor G4-like [Pungitius pungitius]|uniref:adhesion G-protein coupled receptor G4-like n=1 Tax=Pungitius pungitius TaxID=134920 RepID=UPI002E0E679C